MLKVYTSDFLWGSGLAVNVGGDRASADGLLRLLQIVTDGRLVWKIDPFQQASPVF